MNVDIVVVIAKTKTIICAMVMLAILTIYMQRKMTMDDNKYLLQVLENLYLNVLEDVPDNYYTKHLQCAMDDAWEILCAEGVLKDE